MSLWSALLPAALLVLPALANAREHLTHASGSGMPSGDASGHRQAFHGTSAQHRRALQQSETAAQSSEEYGQLLESLQAKDVMTQLCKGEIFVNGTMTCFNDAGVLISDKGEDGYFFDIPPKENTGENMAVDIILQSLIGDANLEVLASTNSSFLKRSVFASIEDRVYVAADELPLGTQLLVRVQASHRAVYRIHVRFTAYKKIVEKGDREIMKQVVESCCASGCEEKFVQAVVNEADHRMCGEGGALPFWYCNQDGNLVHIDLKGLDLRCNLTAIGALRELKQLRALELGSSPGLEGNLRNIGRVVAAPSKIGHLVLRHLPNVEGELSDLCAMEVEDLYVEGSLAAPILSGVFPKCIFRSLKVLHLTNALVKGDLVVPGGAPLQTLNIDQSGLPPDARPPGVDIDLVDAEFVESVELRDLDYTGTLSLGYNTVFIQVRNVLFSKVKFAASALLKTLTLHGTAVNHALLEMVAKAPVLEELHVTDGSLASLPLKWHVPKLRVLEVANASLQGAIPPSLAQLPSLKVLKLRDNELTGSLGPFATALPGDSRLAYLDVSYNGLDGGLPVELSRLATFEEIADGRTVEVRLVNVSSNVLMEGEVHEALLAMPGDAAVFHLDISGNPEMVCPRPASTRDWSVLCDDSNAHASRRVGRKGYSVIEALAISLGVCALLTMCGIVYCCLKKRARARAKYIDVPSSSSIGNYLNTDPVE